MCTGNILIDKKSKPVKLEYKSIDPTKINNIIETKYIFIIADYDKMVQFIPTELGMFDNLESELSETEVVYSESVMMHYLERCVF